MNELQKNNNYDMQDLMNLMGQNMSVVNSLGKQMGDLHKDVDNVRESISEVQKDITDIKENEEITYSQQENIRQAINTRVYKLLKIPLRKDERDIADKVIIKKYCSLFHTRCYSEVVARGHLRKPYRTTQKRNYDLAMQDIEAWYPANGVDALKKEADENALARKIAEEQGY